MDVLLYTQIKYLWKNKLVIVNGHERGPGRLCMFQYWELKLRTRRCYQSLENDFLIFSILVCFAFVLL